jgi:CubicO group peptidase (beta-lactamase class C family)
MENRTLLTRHIGWLALLSLSVLMNGCMRTEQEAETAGKVSAVGIVNYQAAKLLEDPRFHSVSIGIVRQGRSLVRHYGELTIGKGNPPNNQSLYDIASVTKTFTGTLVAHAVLQGRLRLDDDVRLYLKNDYANLEFEGYPVRIKHLLTHTSGFPNFPIRGENQQAYLQGLSQVELKSVPGSTYSYSNMAPELMAYIIQNVYEEDYEALLKDVILHPQNMLDSGYRIAPERSENLVRGYDGEKQLMPKLKRTLWGGMAGLHSTTTDLVEYMHWQLDETDPLVAESHKVLFKLSDDLSIGYHWYINDPEGDISYSHQGGTYGMQNWMVIWPKHDLAISVASNASFEQTSGILEEVVVSLFDQLKGKELPLLTKKPNM